MARRRTTRSVNISLSRYKLGFGLLIIWAFYFFASQMASQSPLFKWLSYPTAQLFGEKWSMIFFGLMTIVWLLIVVWQKYYTRWLFKFWLILITIICGALNFPLLDAWFNTIGTWAMRQMVLENGWWLWYIFLWAINWWLWGEAQAIKIVVIACWVVALIAIGIYYNLKIPTLRFEAIANHYESSKQKHLQQKNQKTTMKKRDDFLCFDDHRKNLNEIKQLLHLLIKKQHCWNRYWKTNLLIKFSKKKMNKLFVNCTLIFQKINQPSH